MRRTMAAAFTVLALGLTGCSDSGQPSEPPTPSEPLTTSSPTTSDDAPTTEPAPPPETESPSETASTEIPPEATEDSEAGAEAFALHYIDLVNATGQSPRRGLLEPLGADGCESCANREESVRYSEENGHYIDGPTFEVTESIALHNPDAHEATVRVGVKQPELEIRDQAGEIVRTVESGEGTLVFSLSWDETWLIEEITLDQAG